MSLSTKDFYYELPEHLIAQSPIAQRDASRLLLLNKVTGETEHKTFKDIVSCLNKGDCIVINDTKVVPARLYGQRKDTGGKVEILLLKRLSANEFETLVKPGRRLKPGDEIIFGDGILTGRVVKNVDDGNRIIEFTFEGIFEEVLNEIGEMPLPPYIKEKLSDKSRYQTVYAKESGSAAAPTAGLHFTPEILDEISKKGIHIAKVTLHVGLGTFRPVKVDDVTEHKMHSEYYSVSKEQADIINSAKENGGRVIAVGTTSLRTLESVADENGFVHHGSGDTEIFIYPPYNFKITDGLITNFHLPESTLIMLVSALCGRENILNAYNEAVKEEYRFFSFGDAMLIV